jgi:hypothetical protein
LPTLSVRVGNDIGSYLFNAIISGCKFSYVHSGDIEIQIPENELQNVPHGRSDFQAIQAECARLFAELTPELTPQQIAFVNRFVGLDCVSRQPHCVASCGGPSFSIVGIPFVLQLRRRVPIGVASFLASEHGQRWKVRAQGLTFDPQTFGPLSLSSSRPIKSDACPNPQSGYRVFRQTNG